MSENEKTVFESHHEGDPQMRIAVGARGLDYRINGTFVERADFETVLRAMQCERLLAIEAQLIEMATTQSALADDVSSIKEELSSSIDDSFARKLLEKLHLIAEVSER